MFQAVDARNATAGSTATRSAGRTLPARRRAVDGVGHHLDRRRDCHVVIAAWNPSCDQERVFEPYFTTKRGGTGLGLAVSRNIVEGMGGRIAMASQPGSGTQIRIELPGDVNSTRGDGGPR
jgi:nitrogen fixation/metabolism regulation signal transduction histidine kinase